MFRHTLGGRLNMYAVGRLGNYISQGVYTVAGPFHPFGGAVDIIVVQQEDGSYKSSPWYVKFGKFQGVLKRSEKVVDVAVNGEAVKFHMFLDSTGEAYFLKDAESDKEESSSSHTSAILSGDEVSVLTADSNKLEDRLDSRVTDEDVEKGESSDEKDSNLALRFEGRKASYLLVQQARAAEEAKNEVSKDEIPKVGDTVVDANTVKEPSTELLSSLAALRLKHSSVTEFENTDGGSAIHALLNQAADVDELQKPGRPSCSLIAQAALASVVKAAAEEPASQLNGINRTESKSALLTSEPSERLNSAEVEKDGLLISEESARNVSPHLIQVVRDGKEVIAEGFQLGKSESFNLRTGHVTHEIVRVKRARSESDLRLYDTGDTSPEVATLMITSADGVVVLHTPRRGSPPPLLLQQDNLQDYSDQNASICDRGALEGEGARNVQTQTSISKEELQSILLEQEKDSQSTGGSGAIIVPESPGISTSALEANVVIADDKIGVGKLDDVNNGSIVSRTPLHSMINAEEVDHGLVDVLERAGAAVESLDTTTDSHNLYSNSPAQDLIFGLEEDSISSRSKTVSPESNGTLFKENEKPALEKRQSTSDSSVPEKKARTMELNDKVANHIDGPVGSSKSEGPSSVELISSPKVKAAVERELAWRDAVQTAAAALKVAPLSANRHCSTRNIDRKLNSSGLKSSPKWRSSSDRLAKTSLGADSNTEAALQRKADPSEILPEHAEKRSWGWWGWRGSTPSRTTSELGDKKDMKDLKDSTEDSNVGEGRSQSVTESQNGNNSETDDALEEGSVGSKALLKGEKSMKVKRIDAQDSIKYEDAGELREAAHEVNEEGSMELTEENVAMQDTADTKSKVDSDKPTEKKGKDEQPSKAAQKTGAEAELNISRRRSLLGLVFRGYDKEQPSAASDAQSRMDDKGGSEKGSLLEGVNSVSHPVEAEEAVEDSASRLTQEMATLDKIEVSGRDTDEPTEVLRAGNVMPLSRESLSENGEDEAHDIQSHDASVDSSMARSFAEPPRLVQMDHSSNQVVDIMAGENSTLACPGEKPEHDLESNRLPGSIGGGDNAADISAASSDSVFESPSAELRDFATTFRGDGEVYHSSDIDSQTLPTTSSPVSSSAESSPESKKGVSFAVSVGHESSEKSSREELDNAESDALDSSPALGNKNIIGDFDSAGDTTPEVIFTSGNGLVLSVPADSVDDRELRYNDTLAQLITTESNSSIEYSAEDLPKAENQESSQEQATGHEHIQSTLLVAGTPLVYAVDSSNPVLEFIAGDLRSTGDSVAPEDPLNERILDEDGSESEDQAESYLSYNRRVASSRSIYFDANTSDEDDGDLQGHLSGGDEDSESTWARSSPMGIPGARVDPSNVYLDGITSWPLSESMPLDRTQFTEAEMENVKTGLSRSLGSEPLLLVQSCAITKSAAEELPRSLVERSPIERTKGDDGVPEQPGNELSEEENAELEEEEYSPETGIELSLCKHMLKDRMGSEKAAKAFNSAKISLDAFRSNGASIATNDKLVVRVGGQYYPWTAAAPVVLGMLAFGQVVSLEIQGAIQVEEPDPSPSKKDVGALVTAGSGGWKLWPFPLRRPKTPEHNGAAPLVSREALLVAAGAGVDSSLMNDLVSQTDYYLRTRKHKVRSFLPTSQMLASMNLKEGSNLITFTFTTRVLGKQQVDARIYLWKWNTRVVISDVDGTITKSDVLGQVMPLVGKDWTQSGVTRLFSAIKENGYEVMFLSARAISQAYLTRQFLLNLKQDGEALPDGPVVISPDGLFPSLYREVIRRAPHEFKIACLQDIRDLFPKDCNPFYAGFGNRDTDEISYLKVGIPKGKIFIINPKGEVAVNNRVDVKSYTSLHKLVDDMFPPQTYTEQEDFNSWNFWKMPLPDIEDELIKSDPKSKSKKSKS